MENKIKTKLVFDKLPVLGEKRPAHIEIGIIQKGDIGFRLDRSLIIVPRKNGELLFLARFGGNYECLTYWGVDTVGWKDLALLRVSIIAGGDLDFGKSQSLRELVFNSQLGFVSYQEGSKELECLRNPKSR